MPGKDYSVWLPQQHSSKTHWVPRLAVGISLAGIFLFLILHRIRLDDLGRALRQTDIAWLSAALLAFCSAYACRIERWRLMLSRNSPGLKWSACAGPLLAGYAANNILPLRAGDVLRSMAFSKDLGAGPSIVIGTLVVERMLDLLIILVLFALAQSVFHSGGQLASMSGPALILVTSLTGAVILFPSIFAPLARTFGRIAWHASPSLGQKLSDQINEVLVTMSRLASGRMSIKLLIWSAFVWLAEGCVFWFVALAMPFLRSQSSSWLALPVGTLATLIPSTPGYLGTFDYFVARAMAVGGASPSASAAYAFVLHALLWLPPTLLGGMYLLIRPIKRANGLEKT